MGLMVEEVAVASTGFGGAWLFKGGRKALEYVRGDARGRELLELWMSGTAPDEVALDSDEWGDYMRAEPDLAKQIYNKLEADAIAMRPRIDDSRSQGHFEEPYNTSFHGEVGRTAPTGDDISGGYFTGYEILHGSKKTVGDVQMMGKVTVVRSPQPLGADASVYTVSYTNLEFVWNDIINPNEQYGADKVSAFLARWENASTGRPTPKDYTVHIQWKSKEPVGLTIQWIGHRPPVTTPIKPLQTFRDQ